MIQRRVSTAVLVIAMLLGMMPILSLAAPSRAPTAQEGTNLLRNPSFEADWGTEGSHRTMVFPRDGGAELRLIGNIFTPPGWTTWFFHDHRADANQGRDQPEVTDAWSHHDARRVRSGEKAIRLFTFYRRHDAGFYQVVDGLQPGASVQFSAHAQAWSCGETTEDATSCGDPWSIVFRVGIDPQGGQNPFAPSVVWSGDHKSPDTYSLIGPVTARVGAQGSVTVFLRSTTRWANKHNDAYWDDARLVTTAPGDPATPPPPPDEPEPTEPPEEQPTETPGPSPTPLPTATPRPDGAIVHVVAAGETLFGIARMYNVPANQIRELNAGSIGPDDMIRVGQELVISVPDEAPAATPVPETPTPTPDAEPEATPTPEPDPDPEPDPEGSSICVLAFHDRDSDGTRDPDTEELLPNVSFTIADASGVVDEYMTDGVSEPYCFTGLAPGSYRVIQQPPGGYEATGPTEQNVALAEGTSFDFQFGAARIEEVESPEETEEEEVGTGPVEEEPAGPGEGLVLADALAIFARVAGILVLILAGAIAVLFVLSRRRRPY